MYPQPAHPQGHLCPGISWLIRKRALWVLGGQLGVGALALSLFKEIVQEAGKKEGL